MFAIAAGYEDANDFDRLPLDTIFKMAADPAAERQFLVLAANLVTT